MPKRSTPTWKKQLQVLNDRLLALGVTNSEWGYSRTKHLFYTRYKSGRQLRGCYYTYEQAEIQCGVLYHIAGLVANNRMAREGDHSAIASYNHHVEKINELQGQGSRSHGAEPTSRF